MVVVKNIEGKELELPFEGVTYIFPKNAKVLVEEKVSDELKERWGLAFEFDLPLARGEQIPKVRTTKTKAVIIDSSSLMADMKATVGGTQSNMLNPESETDNAGFVGPGIEEDEIT